MNDSLAFTPGDFEAREALNLTALIERRRPVVFATMRTLDITEIHITYDGEGDEGQLTDIKGFRYPSGYRLTGGPEDMAARIDVDLTERHAIDAGNNDTHLCFFDFLDEFAWNLLNLRHDGFEINDGGFGTITITVADETIRMEMSDRFTDFSTTEAEV